LFALITRVRLFRDLQRSLVIQIPLPVWWIVLNYEGFAIQRLDLWYYLFLRHNTFHQAARRDRRASIIRNCAWHPEEWLRICHRRRRRYPCAQQDYQGYGRPTGKHRPASILRKNRQQRPSSSGVWSRALRLVRKLGADKLMSSARGSVASSRPHARFAIRFIVWLTRRPFNPMRGMPHFCLHWEDEPLRRWPDGIAIPLNEAEGWSSQGLSYNDKLTVTNLD